MVLSAQSTTEDYIRAATTTTARMIIVGIHLYGALSIALAEARYASKKMQVYRPSTDKKPGHYLIHSNFRGRPFLMFMERLLKLEKTQNKERIGGRKGFVSELEV